MVIIFSIRRKFFMPTHLQRNDDFVLQKGGVLNRIINTVFRRKRTIELQMNSEETELLKSLKKAREEWISACIEFEYAGDQDIIDYHTYKIKAYQLKYEYYLKKAKEKGIKASILDSLDNPETHASVQRLKV